MTTKNNNRTAKNDAKVTALLNKKLQDAEEKIELDNTLNTNSVTPEVINDIQDAVKTHTITAEEKIITELLNGVMVTPEDKIAYFDAVYNAFNKKWYEISRNKDNSISITALNTVLYEKLSGYEVWKKEHIKHTDMIAFFNNIEKYPMIKSMFYVMIKYIKNDISQDDITLHYKHEYETTSSTPQYFNNALDLLRLLSAYNMITITAEKFNELEIIRDNNFKTANKKTSVKNLTVL